jgi:hypothetical protein
LRPSAILLDRSLAARAVPSAQLGVSPCSFAELWSEAIVELACMLAERGESIWWLPDRETCSPTLQRLKERGLRVEANEPATGPRIVVAETVPVEQLRAEDRLILIRRSSESAAQVAAAEGRGAAVFLPPVGDLLAARAALWLRLKARLGAERRAGGLTAPMIAPRDGELMVDDLAQPTAVLDQGRLTLEAASQRVSEQQVRHVLEGRRRH